MFALKALAKALSEEIFGEIFKQRVNSGPCLGILDNLRIISSCFFMPEKKDDIFETFVLVAQHSVGNFGL